MLIRVNRSHPGRDHPSLPALGMVRYGTSASPTAQVSDARYRSGPCRRSPYYTEADVTIYVGNDPPRTHSMLSRIWALTHGAKHR